MTINLAKVQLLKTIQSQGILPATIDQSSTFLPRATSFGLSSELVASKDFPLVELLFAAQLEPVALPDAVAHIDNTCCPWHLFLPVRVTFQ